MTSHEPVPAANRRCTVAADSISGECAGALGLVGARSRGGACVAWPCRAGGPGVGHRAGAWPAGLRRGRVRRGRRRSPRGWLRRRPDSSRTAGHTRSSITSSISPWPLDACGMTAGRNAICTRLSFGSAPRQRWDVPVIAAGTIGVPVSSASLPAPWCGDPERVRRLDACAFGEYDHAARRRTGSLAPSPWPARRRRHAAPETLPGAGTANPTGRRIARPWP